MVNNETLSKLVQKAKNKLNKRATLGNQTLKSVNVYQWETKQSDRKQIEKELELKIINLKKKNPDATNPLSLIMDKDYYDKLSENAKEKYLLWLSKAYQSILKKIS